MRPSSRRSKDSGEAKFSISTVSEQVSWFFETFQETSIRFNEMKEKMEEMEERMEDLEERMEEMEDLEEKMEDKLGDLEEKIEEKTEELREMEDRIEEMGETDDKIEELENEIADKTTQLTRQEKQVTELQEKTKKTNQETLKLFQAVGDLSNRLLSIDLNTDKSMKKIQRTNDYKKTTQDKSAAKQARLKAMQEKYGIVSPKQTFLERKSVNEFQKEMNENPHLDSETRKKMKSRLFTIDAYAIVDQINDLLNEEIVEAIGYNRRGHLILYSTRELTDLDVRKLTIIDDIEGRLKHTRGIGASYG